MAAPHLLGGTNTAGALDMIYNQGLFGVPAGGRDNATKMLIIMTDGQSANITQCKYGGVLCVSCHIAQSLNFTS